MKKVNVSIYLEEIACDFSNIKTNDLIINIDNNVIRQVSYVSELYKNVKHIACHDETSLVFESDYDEDGFNIYTIDDKYYKIANVQPHKGEK
jgi:hypothetical protein